MGGISSIGQGATIAISINAVDKFSSVFRAASLGIGAVATSMKIATIAIVATGAALAGIGIASLKTAAEFETAFAGVRKTVELSEKEFTKLEDKFKDISKTTPIAFTEIAHIGELAGQLGVSGVKNIEKFTKTIADISVTTNMTAETAATEFARIANVMQLPLDQVDRMGATIVDLGNNFATTEAEISTFAQRVAGAGKIAGLSTSDVMGIGTAFTSVGVQAEAGGTAVQKMLIKMNTSVQQGGEELEIFAKTAGITTEEFKKGWEKDAGMTFANFVTGLGSQGDAAIGTLEELGMSDVRLVRSFLSLAGAGDLITNTMNVANDAWKENTALVEEAEKRYDTYDSKVLMLKNTFATFRADIGDKFMPIMKDLVILFTEKVLPALEPLIPLFGDFFKKAIESIIPHVESMTENFVEFASILLKDVIPNILPLITLVGRFLRNAFIEVFNVIKPLLPEFVEFAKLIFDSAMKVVENLLPAIKSLIPTVVNFWNSLKPLIPKLFEFIEKLAVAAITIFNELMPAMSYLVPIVMDVIDVVMALIPPITNIITTLIRLVANILKGTAPAINVLKTVFLAILEPIKVVVGWILDLIDLIGDFLGLSSDLNKSASASVKTVSDSYKSSKSSSSSSNYNNSSSYTKPISYSGYDLASDDKGKQHWQGEVIKLNDFIISGGKLIKPSQQDTIIGTKNPNSLGGGITIIIEGDMIGLDSDDISSSIAKKIKEVIRI